MNKTICLSLLTLLLSSCSNNSEVTKEPFQTNQNTEQTEVVVEAAIGNASNTIPAINNVSVGMLFSELVHLLPENTPIEKEIYDGSYIVYLEDQTWNFYEDGVLSFIVTNGFGTGLNNIKVGDDSYNVISALGTPTFEEENFYSYEYGTYELQFYITEGTIEDVRILLKAHINGNQDESKLIQKYYEKHLASKSIDETVELESQPTDQKEVVQVETKQENNIPKTTNPQTAKKEATTVKNNEINKTPQPNKKTFTRSELTDLAIKVDEAFTLYQQTVYGSKGNSYNEKQKILQDTFDKNHFWDIGGELEIALVNINERDMDIYEFVVRFMDAVDTAYSFQLTAYNMIISGTGSDKEIQSMEELASEESARAIEIYEWGKRKVKLW
jgi:hypothetical protein